MLTEIQGYGGQFNKYLNTAGGPDLFLLQQFSMFFNDLDKPLPIQNVVAFQTYMDIVDLTEQLNASSLRALVQLHRSVSAKYDGFDKGLVELNAGHTFRKKFLKSEAREAIQTSRQMLWRLLRLDPQHQDMLFGTTRSPFVSNFPVFAGHITESLMSRVYMDGVQTCDEDAIVMGVATLYNACRSCGLLRKEWVDMAFFIEHVTPAVLGISKAADSRSPILHAAKQNGLALGVPLKEYSKEKLARRGNNARVPLPSANQIEGRRRRVRVRALHLHQNFEFQDKLKILGPSQMEKAAQAALYSHIVKLVENPEDPIEADIRIHWEASHTLTPCELLSVLEAYMTQEELSMHFDYHTLFLYCANMLNQLKNGAFRNANVSVRARLPAEYSMVQMIDEILWEAAEVEMRGGGLRAIVETTTLGLVAAWFKVDIEEMGSDIYKEAIRLRNSQRYNFAEDSTTKHARKQTPMSMAGSKVAYERPEPKDVDEEHDKNVKEHMKRAEERIAAGGSTEEVLAAFQAEYDREEAARNGRG